MYAALRTHGHHSLLTGVDSPARLLARAAELGLPALALCDVDTLSGLHDFLRAEDRGVRRIVGAELSDPRGEPGRVIALVRDEQGFQNLCKLVSARQLGGDPGDPSARVPANLAASGAGANAAGADDAAEPRFDLVSAVARHQRGLTFIVDHPRLAFALAERVPKEFLYVAIAPGCLRRAARARVERAGPQ
ncbi:MAG: PHP domain-containing protein, partial [Planctomycetes bacterium]|nr:PHP domain-containing protein [Planctomycetota bacterium]